MKNKDVVSLSFIQLKKDIRYRAFTFSRHIINELHVTGNASKNVYHCRRQIR